MPANRGVEIFPNVIRSRQHGIDRNDCAGCFLSFIAPVSAAAAQLTVLLPPVGKAEHNRSLLDLDSPRDASDFPLQTIAAVQPAS